MVILAATAVEECEGEEEPHERPATVQVLQARMVVGPQRGKRKRKR